MATENADVSTVILHHNADQLDENKPIKILSLRPVKELRLEAIKLRDAKRMDPGMNTSTRVNYYILPYDVLGILNHHRVYLHFFITIATHKCSDLCYECMWFERRYNALICGILR